MKKIVILGGGTFSKVACHLALATPAFGTTARQLSAMYGVANNNFKVEMKLTKMADHTSDLIYTEDVQHYVQQVIEDSKVKVVIFNVAICDFEMSNPTSDSRLSSQEDYDVQLKGVGYKLIRHLREQRPDIFIVGFKTTSYDTNTSQTAKGRKLLESNGLNLVLANDVGTRTNVLISSGGWVNECDRQTALQLIVTESLVWLKKQHTKGNTFEAFKCYQ